MAGQMKMAPDMVIRDPNELNSHIKVMFEDVIGEPEGVRSLDCVWLNSFKCFECGKNLCYRLMTVFCGVCIALFWGCDFALTSFAHIWCWTPCLRDFSIGCGCLKKFFTILLDCCLTPICESFAMVFSRINLVKH